MKFWKIRILTTLLFFGVIAIFLYSSCEKNVCDNVTCFNGGSCNAGTCRCPVGYEGSQCQTLSVARFVGTYWGTRQCIDNNSPTGTPVTGPNVIDSAWITADVENINFVYVSIKSLQPKLLHGYVNDNASTYAIIIPSDSSLNYLKVYSLTLQDNQDLNMHTYLTNEAVPGDTVIEQCTFAFQN